MLGYVKATGTPKNGRDELTYARRPRKFTVEPACSFDGETRATSSKLLCARQAGAGPTPSATSATIHVEVCLLQQHQPPCRVGLLAGCPYSTAWP